MDSFFSLGWNTGTNQQHVYMSEVKTSVEKKYSKTMDEYLENNSRKIKV